MAITEQVTMELASVEVTDEYRVEVKQHRRRMDYSPAQAIKLAQDLVVQAVRATEMIQEHAIADAARIKAHPVSEAL